MTRRDELSEQDVITCLAEKRGPASLREIAAQLQLQHRARQELKKTIEKMKRKGDVEEVQSGRYRLAGRVTAKSHVSLKAGAPQARAAKQASPQEGGGEPPHSKPKRDANVIAGRLVAHRDGYGFVVPDVPVPGMEGDLFVGAASIGDAMHGDRVEARIERRRRDGRAEGRIVRVTKRAHPTVVGLFRYGDRGNAVIPFDTRLLQEIIIPPGEELPREVRKHGSGKPHGAGRASPADERRQQAAALQGAVVNVELTRYPRGGVQPAGRVLEVLGRPGDPGVDLEIIIRKHHLPNEFPDEVQAAAHATPQEVRPQDRASRRDFRGLPIVTIDGETAKDFDDAVHVRRLPGGNFELQVHIADVAAYVPRGSALDREARVRGTSVYFPDRAIPMLPEALSNGICSLNPKVDRLVMSAVMEIDGRGHTVKSEFTPGVIHSAERMTYTNVNKVLEGDPEASGRYRALADHFRLMRELALVLNGKRSRRGSIDFDLPEPVIEFDALGQMKSIVRSERNIAHRIIEEFMLAANEAVASYLENRAIASLHRVHEKPDPKKVLEFEELARAFGYSLGVADLAERRIPVKHGRVPSHGRTRSGQRRERQMVVALPDSTELNITPHHYQRLTEKIAGQPEERILSYLMLRSLKQARYAAEPLGHFALGAEHYTHFTSPIRRYPDLIVHRVLKWALENPGAHQGLKPRESSGDTRGAAGLKPRPADGQGGPYRVVELEEIASESSEAERRADGAERELIDWKTAQFMEAHLGEEFDALVISVLKFGFFVELFEHFVEGLVPIETLEDITGERCLFRERDRVISTERGKRRWRLGDRVRVRADRIDHIRHRVEFALVP
jgi:ribonuclease R